MKSLLHYSITSLLLFLTAACTFADKKSWEEFSGERALAHVQHLVDLGPRPPESNAIEEARSYITKQLKSFGWKITRQEFSDDTPRGKKHFVNLIARFSE